MLKRLLLAMFILVMAGPAVTQAPLTHIENKVVAEGDSISVYWVGSYPGIYDTKKTGVTVTGLATSGAGISTVANRISQVYAANGEVVTLLIGANDLNSSTRSTAQWLAQLWAYTDTLRSAGYKVAVGTVLPRCGSGDGAAFDTEHNRRRNVEANPAIRAAVGIHIDAVIDYAADPVMGPDSAPCNHSLYIDGLHPTDGNVSGTGGQDKLEAIYEPVVDALLLSPSQTPAPKVFVKPPDVPAWGDTTVNMYAAGTTLNKLGNGIDPDGGTPPAAAYELPDVPTSPVGWANQTAQGTGNFCPIIAFGGTCQQAKARFNANITHILFDDPVRNYGQPGTSHCHEFFGNGSTNAFSTFAKLRGNATRYSASSGGPLNGTAYWFPCIIKPNAFGDGKDYVVRPDFAIFYYTAPSAAATAELTYLMLGLRYVSGFNMDDGIGGEKLGQWLQDKVDAANAQPGTSGRYSIYNSAGFNGVIWKWVCGGQIVNYRLANAAGTDPFNGACAAGSQLILQFSGAGCWDGINMWSPGGYKHVVPTVWDNVAGKFVCPNGWYSLPVLQIELSFTHNGPSDYTKWVCASDPNGSDHCSTFHTDWMNGWDKTTLHSWMDNCLGVNATPHECNDSTVGPSLRLFRAEAGATGRSPQVNIAMGQYNTTDPSRMWLLPDTSNGPKTLHVH